jgi:hypothetical protein
MKKFLLIPILFILFSCVKNNPDPTWLEIKPWTLEANPTLNGSEKVLTSDFGYAWVFANGQLLGVFELPVKIPILTEGTTKLQIYPTILNNGISATKKIYPFVEAYEVSVNFVKNTTTVIQPVTRYKSTLSFDVRDFDDADPEFETDASSDVNFVVANDPAYLKWGSGYGFIEMDSDHTYFAASSTGQMVLPKGQDVYLEIDYLNSNDVITGVIELSSAGITNHQNIQMNDQEIGKEVWKKIYIDLREIVSGTPVSTDYKISLQAYFQGGDVPRKILLDNVKVIHF